jgi:hypothetical protein
MQHLESLRLAALDHDPATAAELAHLAACAGCRAERDAYTALAQLALDEKAVEAAADAPRLTEWSALSRRLRDEGLIRSTGEHSLPAVSDAPLVIRSLHGADLSTGHQTPVVPLGTSGSQRRHVAPWMRVAAALVLVLGGAVMGRVTSEHGLIPGGGATAAQVASDARTSAMTAGSADFGSVEEATGVLLTAQRDYELAALWLASNDTTVHSPDVYRARLAALDQMMAATRAALRDAPQDPVLNQYYLAAYTAREATLQQLVGTLPVDKTIEGF